MRELEGGRRLLDNFLDELRSGKRAVGLKQSKRAAEEGRVRMAFVAADAPGKLTEPLLAVLSERGVPFQSVPTMRELGKAAGIDVGAACAVLLCD